ncbi:hypothetical protein ACIO8H_35815 [Streptomyces sp. NPDC087226]|uniref:hypothetical protein n=1 Tax=Streptomyces sp. NPDC087226 TaxID=3365771 RepID=UPI0038288E05
MPLFEIDPGQSPEAPGTLSFYKQGADPSTGFQVTSEGVITAAGGQEVNGDLMVTGDAAVTGSLDVDGYAEFQAGQFDGQLSLWSGSASLRIGTAGGGLAVKEGTNATLGVATLVAGAATVATTKVTATSRIFLTPNASGGTPGWVRVSARVAGTSFTITSSSGTDTSQVAWFIVEPAA